MTSEQSIHIKYFVGQSVEYKSIKLSVVKVVD